ncbi:Fructose dehydrogenase cytochrome subunit [Dyadobacter sp. CECT 9623]|uniref:Fructose dehydrogenase cytochrome subunit n=1 Tax=Dyadobacter linearis TaxID=2823330 RepID=A0ABM8UY66_9BACT|nr:c-type cytochrome [Dyadobacter sp. CECT 9623]CAG5074559.1 Fructose dehydrogenase cytochrome subunit [Dyadobacter sp. CECT 9623]
MKKFFKIFGVILLLFIILVAGAGIYVKSALPNVGEPPVITIEKTPARIERGKYLANHVSVCMDCHSTRDWNYFAAPLSGNFGGGGEKFSAEMGFPGNFYARNITPYALANWTDGEIFRAVTTGVSKNGNALFPVMPYHGFGQMDQEDIYSIIVYLRTLEPVKNEVPESVADFPVSILLNTMPSKATFTKMPAETDQIAYGKYLVTAASCVECHSKMEKGARVEGTDFGGGMEFKIPTGTLRSPNITSDKATGIGSWTEEGFVKRFKTYADSSYKPHRVGPKEFNTVMPWNMYAGMKESDLKAIYAYLQTVRPLTNVVTKFEPIP